MRLTPGAANLLISAISRADSNQRELAILDARAALTDDANFKKYMAQFKRVKRDR